VGIEIYISEDRLVAFVVLLSFLITFGLTRLYTRLARTRGWGSGHAGDIHLHHMVFGILFILFSGWSALALDPGTPWVDLLAILFGAGAALTLDEFALWLHLKDVYWAKEGRSSVDAVIIATMLGGLVVLGVTPFGITKETSGDAIAIAAAISVFASLIAVLKGKVFLGLAGIFIPIVGIVAAIRLARPSSPWARWRYKKNPAKMAKALGRDLKREARKTRMRNWIGGAPSLEPPQI
jgi:hypothetical protein